MQTGDIFSNRKIFPVFFEKKREIISVLLLILLVFSILVPVCPAIKQIPDRDSGVFLYIGQEILEGNLPYAAVWDHKPPGIYYLDAAGLYFMPGSWWGVWVLEVISLLTSALLSFFLLKKFFSPVSAFFGTAIWMIGLIATLDGGNLTSEYALPFQFLSICLFVMSEESDSPAWAGLLMGVLATCLILLNPTVIGISISIIGSMIILHRGNESRIKTLTSVAYVLVGSAISLIPVVAYFIYFAGAPAFFDSIVRYNLVYSAQPLATKVLAIITGMKILFPLSMIGILAWGLGIYWIQFRKNEVIPCKPFLVVALIDFPLELLFSGTTGETYPHYFIAWLPSLAILSGFLTFIFLHHADSLPGGGISGHRKTISAIIVVIFLLIVSLNPLVSHLHLAATPPDSLMSTRLHASDYIRAHSGADDTVLMWGAETSVNYLSGRKSPSRFVYQYPLYLRNYQNDDMIASFNRDLQDRKPLLIIDTSATNPVIPPLDPVSRATPWKSSDAKYSVSPSMSVVFDYISTHYHLAGNIGPGGWAVYRVNDPGTV